MSDFKRSALLVLVAFIAAFSGVLFGRTLFEERGPVESELHMHLHENLNLDSTQAIQIDILEKQFAIRKQALERELRDGNEQLAEAIEAEHGYGPKVSVAVDSSHQAMGTLQKETIQHIFAIRKVLRSDQAEKFDRAVVKTLTTSNK